MQVVLGADRVVHNGKMIFFVSIQVRSSVIQMLPSVELDDLPVVVKFILQSVGDNDAFEVRCINITKCAIEINKKTSSSCSPASISFGVKQVGKVCKD